MSKLSCVFALLLVHGGLETAGAQTERTLPQLLGVTVEDVNPHGCVSCHIFDREKDKDVRLTTFVAEWTVEVAPELLAKARAAAPQVEIVGRHPDILEAIEVIPADCLTCHSKESRQAPPFATLVHLIHLTGGIDSTFVTTYQGNCTYCHALDIFSGRWSIKNGIEK